MGKVFKKSLMGFSKDQVIAYIDSLVEKQQAALSEEKERNTQLVEENERLTKERDDAVSIAKEELLDEMELLKEQISSLTEEKDGLLKQLTEAENEKNSLSEQNEKLTQDKEELFESVKSVKAQLAEYIKNESELKDKLNALTEDNKNYAGLLSEVTRLKLKNAQLEAQLKHGSVPKPAPVQTVQTEKTEEVWESLKGKINELADDFSELANTVKQEDSRSAASKTISIKDILEKVKRIGEKI